jgi:excisionase family DNA binding protein
MIARDTPSPASPRLALTASEIAAGLGVSIRTVMAMTANNEIPHCHIGKRNLRYPLAEIEAWLAARTCGAVSPGAKQFAAGKPTSPSPVLLVALR